MADKPEDTKEIETDSYRDLSHKYADLAKPSEGLRKAVEDMANAHKVNFESLLPKFEPPPMPKFKPVSFENANAHASARSLLESLNRYYTEWAAKIDKEHQVVIYVVLANGAIIRANQLIEEGFNGIAVEGDLSGMPCVLLLQQSSLQFLCVAEKIEPDQLERRKIGFIFGDSK